jgi:hypothetical protein
MNDGTRDQTGKITETTRLAILAEAGLWTNDPERYPGLVERMEPSAGLDFSFNALRYDTSGTTRRMVPCSICPQRQPHHKGAIVKLMSGHVGLVGHDCGDRHFFGEGGWSELQNRLDAAAEAALFARRWGPAKAALDVVIARLDAWAGTMQKVKNVQAVFSSRLPALSKRMGRSIGHGELTAEREITEVYRTATGEERTKTRFINEIVFRTSAPWFYQGKDLAASLANFVKLVREAQKLLRADATSQNVEFIKRILRRHFRDLADIGRMQEDLSSIGTQSSLRQLSEWANRSNAMSGNFSAGEGSLRFRSKKGETVEVEFVVPVAELNEHWQVVKSAWPNL